MVFAQGLRSKSSKQTIREARRRRKAPTLAEETLWDVYLSSKSKIQLQRQIPAADHILDFFCPRYRFAIEIAGQRQDAIERDGVSAEERANALSSLGILSMNLDAQDVSDDAEGAFSKIVAFVAENDLVAEARRRYLSAG